MHFFQQQGRTDLEWQSEHQAYTMKVEREMEQTE